MLGSIFSGIAGLLGNLFGGGATGGRQINQENANVKRANAIARTTEEKLAREANNEQVSTVTRLREPVAQALEADFLRMLQQRNTRRRQIESIVNDEPFDADGFVNATVGAARTGLREELQANINRLAGDVGVNAAGNSAVALLQDRMLRRGEAQLGGIAADARMRAEDVQRGKEAMRLNIEGALGSELTNALNALLQARQVGNVKERQRVKDRQQGRIGSTETIEENVRRGNTVRVYDSASPWGSVFNAISGMLSARF